MRSWRRTVFLLLLGLLLVPGSLPARADQSPQLILYPNAVHPEAPFYVAGSGFPAGQDLTVFLFCNSWYQSHYGHWMWTLSGSKIRDGSFAGWELHTPHPFTRDPVGCMLYASDGENPYGAQALITIWPASSALTPVHIQVQLQVHAISAAQRTATVDVSATAPGSSDPAPGATVILLIRYAGQLHLPARVLRVVLPWTGHARLHWQLPRAVRRGQRVQLIVRGHLGVFPSGKPVTHSVVVR